MREMENLDAIYDGAKSFYGKAKIEYCEPIASIKLYSYESFIASYNLITKELYISSLWDYSQTTLRHLKEFIKQYKGEDLTKQEIWEKYTEEGKEYAKAKEYRKVLREFKKEFKKDFTDEEIEEMAQNEVKY